MFDSIAKHWFTKESDCVSRGRCCKTNSDSIEMLESIAPDTQFLRGVTSVTFVCDDEIKRINRDVEPVRIVVIVGIIRLREC